MCLGAPRRKSPQPRHVPKKSLLQAAARFFAVVGNIIASVAQRGMKKSSPTFTRSFAAEKLPGTGGATH
jgi:hypothetical protein